MENEFLHSILQGCFRTVIEPSPDAMKKLAGLPFEDLGFAHIDHHRSLRKGYPEVIFCQNKTPEQVVSITRNIMAHGETVFGTRASKERLTC